MKNKPYSRSQGRPVIDWWAVLAKLKEIKKKHPSLSSYVGSLTRINDALKNYNYGRPTDKKISRQEVSLYKAALKHSMEWVTCACGNQCELVPRDTDGAPFDSLLHRLGQEFPRRISDFEIIEAEFTLRKIEKRSIEVLRAKKRELTKTIREAKRELKRFK